MPFEPWNNCMKKRISICKKIINLKVLRNTLFKMLIPVSFPGIKGCVQIVIFTPPHAKYPQISDEDSTFFLFIIGSSQLISKILLAFFVYCNFISKHTILSIALLLTSVSCMFISLYTNFVTMTILSVIYGLFGNFLFGLFPAILVEFVGYRPVNAWLRSVYIKSNIG